MGSRGEAWSSAARYAADVADVEKLYGRNRGVPPERLAEMRSALRLLKQGDEHAFNVVVSEDYATHAAQAVAQLLAIRAEAEQEADAVSAAATPGPPIGDDDPTPVAP
jgi:CHASE3 domain sensor protein